VNGIGDWIRLANIFLAGGSLFVLLLTLLRRWEQLTPRIRRIGASCALILFVIAYGSGEAMSSDVPPGVRAVMMLVALASLVGSLLWHFDEGL
jgi:hypothetical protein